MDRPRKRSFDLSSDQLALLEARIKAKGLTSQYSQAKIYRCAASDRGPISFAQQRLWFLDKLEQGSPLYNIPNRFRITGTLDVPALQNSLAEIIRRHEVLRTTFHEENGQAFVRVNESQTLDLPLVDLRHLPADTRQCEAERITREEAYRPFNLSQGPVIRAMLLKLADGDHLLLLTLHHIVSDRWSTGILLSELQDLYTAHTAGRPSRLAELPVQYTDYASWQRRHLQGETLESLLTYWRDQLADAPPLLELPTDRPRPTVQTYRGAKYETWLPRSLTNSLHALGKQMGATLFMTTLAAYYVLLHRYTRQDDIVVGTPIANRTSPEVEGLVGLFANSLPLRARLAGNPTFRELLATVRASALSAYAHQDLPFDLMVHALRPERNVGHSPVFQTMFILQNTPAAPLVIPGLTIQFEQADTATAKFDLTLALEERSEGLRAVIEYNTDLFDTNTIRRMADHYQTLLNAIAANPDAGIGDLPLLTNDERHLILVGFNQAEGSFADLPTVVTMFEKQAFLRPEAVAVELNGQPLSYRDLNNRANQLARRLQEAGVQPESPIGVFMERSLELVVGILGIMKAGCVYVPLDPAHPKDRLSMILEDMQAQIVLTQTDLHPLMNDHAVLTICLDTACQKCDEQTLSAPPTAAGPGHLAYIIYTSGSTGRPKGVMVEHRNLSYIVHTLAQRHRFTESSRTLQFSNISFDISLWDIFLTLTQGGTLVMAPAERLRDPAALASLLQRSGISHAMLTPSFLSQLPAEVGRSVQAMYSIGEVCPTALALAWAQHTRFVNTYGPTETTILVTDYEVLPSSNPVGSIPIGRPIPHTQIYILDPYGQPAPIGCPGEIHIGGPCVTRGYLNRPELTAEKFVPNPFGPETSTRLYRTGDLGRFLANGTVEFLGRIDHQVKLRGFRVELGEIEAVLDLHPGIQQSVAVIREDSPGDKRLVAYVVPNGAQAPAGPELRSFLKERLPEYMIPAIFVSLESFPKTASGKVDRKALPKTGLSRSDLSKPFVAPSTEAERILAKIWSDILAVESVGVDDSFFELGGDSILSLRIVAAANQAGLAISLKQLFQYPTVQELAAVATPTPKLDSASASMPGAIPLTPGQHFLLEEEPLDASVRQTLLVLKVSESCSESTARQALFSIVAHHDALRYRFRWNQGAWVQFLDDSAEPLHYEVMDFSGHSAPDEAEAAVQLDCLAQSNNLAGPAIRAVWCQRPAGQPAHLILAVNPLVADAFSWSVIVEDLAIACQQLQSASSVHLPAKTSPVANWAEKMVEMAHSPGVLGHADSWVRDARLDEVAPITNSLEGADASVSTPSVETALGLEESIRLARDLPQLYRMQVADVLLTALTTTITQSSGKQSVVLDLERHGREDSYDGLNYARTVGCFTAHYPVRLQVAPGMRPIETFKSVKEQLGRVPMHGLAYGLLRYLSGDPALRERMQQAHRPDISFSYLGWLDQAPSDSRTVTLHGFRYAAGLSAALRQSGICVRSWVWQNQLRVIWTYRTDQYPRRAVERLADQLLEEIRSIIRDVGPANTSALTPTDFPAAKLDQPRLDQLLARLRGRAEEAKR